MKSEQKYECPICGFIADTTPRVSFPYSAKINDSYFKYLKCDKCSTVYVNPTPNNENISLMYKGGGYHDHYNNPSRVKEYEKSVNLLSGYLSCGDEILDYGCGDGYFLYLLSRNGFDSTGVEYNTDAVKYAVNSKYCNILSVNSFQSKSYKERFNVIHLGDVLEHMPWPANTLNDILSSLKHGGVLFVEGPLENNSSPVYWFSHIFGIIKKITNPHVNPSNSPYHLFRVGSRQQYNFFLNRIDADLELKYWNVYDTGWPYIEGKFAKHIIAKIAIFISGKRFFKVIFGNRFQAVFIKR
jgi:SAM-dependent methyltransferase